MLDFIYSSGNPASFNFFFNDFVRFLEVSCLTHQEASCLHDYCMYFSTFSFFFCSLNIPITAILQISAVLPVPTRDKLHLPLSQVQTSDPGAELGATICLSYGQLRRLSTPLPQSGMWPHLPSSPPPISTNVVSDLLSHIREKCAFPLSSLPPPPVIFVFFTPSFLHLRTQGSTSGKL